MGNSSTADGMSLRDHFAAKAMQGFISSGAMDNASAKGVDPIENRNAVVFAAYDLADAMLKERAK